MELEARGFNTSQLVDLPIELFYQVISNYGRSFYRPIVAMFFALFGLACVFQYIADGEEIPPTPEIVALSGTYLFAVLPAFKGRVAETVDCLFPNGPTLLFYMFATFESAIGTVLIFLTGLALRNKFRL